MLERKALLPLLFSTLVCLWNPNLHAASPVLNGILPRGAQRATETDFVLSGARLSDAKEILLYDPGLTVTKLKVVNDNQVKATFRSAADCRLGEHALRLRTAGGLTELRTLYIGASARHRGERAQ